MDILLNLLGTLEPFDAASPDKNFGSKYLLHDAMRVLVRPNIRLITGEKGIGKTALCKYLTNQYEGAGVPCTLVSFNELRYIDVVHYASDLGRVTGLDALSVMSAFWRSVIVITAMQSAAQKLPASEDHTHIVSFLKDCGHYDRSAVDILVSLIERVWKIIETVTAPRGRGSDTAVKLPADSRGEQIGISELEYIRKYPFSDSAYREAEAAFHKLLSSNGKSVAVLLDGFDKLRGDGLQAKPQLDIIFSGLIDAVYTLSLDEALSESLVTKVLIPHDRWLVFRPRDRDKIRTTQFSITWSYPQLKEFFRKRFALSNQFRNNASFDTIWAQLFPWKVTNTKYQIQEHVFDYMLRHTLYRPRQLQLHFRQIALAFHADDVIDPDKIPGIIAASCRELVEDYIEEYKIDHPRLREFLELFEGIDNVMRWSAMRGLVESFLKNLGHQHKNTIEKAQQLYEIGFLGVVEPLAQHDVDAIKHEAYLPSRTAKFVKNGSGTEYESRYRCCFYYLANAPDKMRKLHDDQLVCIHPMFFDFCRLNPDPNILIG